MFLLDECALFMNRIVHVPSSYECIVKNNTVELE